MTTPDPKTGPELLPCPFCGNIPRKPNYYFMDSCWHMGCHDESHPVIEFRAYVPNPENADDKAARLVSVVASWNTRTALPAFDAVVKALEAVLPLILDTRDEAVQARASLALADKVRGSK